jgi:hypothetical protein
METLLESSAPRAPLKPGLPLIAASSRVFLMLATPPRASRDSIYVWTEGFITAGRAYS